MPPACLAWGDGNCCRMGEGTECSLLFRIPDPLLVGEVSQALSLSSFSMWMHFHVGKLPFFYPGSISSAWSLYYTTPAMGQTLPGGVMVEECALPDQTQLVFLQPSRSVSKPAYLDDDWLLSNSMPAGLPPKHLAQTQSLGMDIFVNLLPADFGVQVQHPESGTEKNNSPFFLQDVGTPALLLLSSHTSHTLKITFKAWTVELI